MSVGGVSPASGQADPRYTADLYVLRTSGDDVGVETDFCRLGICHCDRVDVADHLAMAYARHNRLDDRRAQALSF